MRKIKKFLTGRQRLGQITNEKIVPGDFYERTWRKGSIIVVATYGIPKKEKCFCGTVIEVEDHFDFPVGVHQKDWPITDFK